MHYLRRRDGPGLAEHTVDFAVDHSEVRRRARSADQRDGFDPCFVCALANAEAGFVAASDVDHPVLDARAGSRGTRDEDLVVIVERDAVDFGIGYFARTGCDWVWHRDVSGEAGVNCRGGGGGGLAEEAFDLVDEGELLLRGGQGGERREKGGRGAHCAVVCRKEIRKSMGVKELFWSMAGLDEEIDGALTVE